MTLRNEYLLGKIGDYAADHKEVDMLVSGTNRQVRYYLHCHTSHLVVFVNINLAQANKLYRVHTSLVTGYWLLVTGDYGSIPLHTGTKYLKNFLTK